MGRTLSRRQMAKPSSISKLNERIWNRKDVAREHRSKTDLFKAESFIFDHLAEEFRDKAILDIGMGAGRTTRQLLNISKKYIGIDYSQKMVCAARHAFPGVELLEMDARNLSVFAKGQFDLICFSFNGIDYASHNERLEMLTQIHSVLRDDGAFIFSSHNRDSEVLPAYHLRHMRSRLSANPVQVAKGLVVYLLGIYNSARLKSGEVHAREYAIINDPSYAYGLLVYYISLEQQLLQLTTLGFRDIISFGLDGEVLQPNSTYNGSWIYYVARK